MSKQELIPRYCPQCGSPLENQTCTNRSCVNFGIAIKLTIEQTEVAVNTPDTPFVANNRRFTLLLDDMSKEQPTNYWEQLQDVCHRQLIYLSEAATALSAIEKDLRNINLPPADRERTLNQLNRIASLIEKRATFACLIGEKASAVVLADINLKAADDQLQSDYRKLKTIEQQEGKNA